MAQLPQISTVRNAPGKSDFRRRMPSSLREGIPLLVVSAILVTYGLVVCWSATTNDADYSFSRQLFGVFIGLVCMGLVWRFDYRRLANLSTVFLVINVVLILLPQLPVIGVERNGARSWINIGMQLQPGEFAKVTVVLFAASLVARYRGRLEDPREYVKVVALLLIPFVCILTQPDLGTGLVYLFIAAVALVMGGARVKHLLITLLVAIGLLVLLLVVDELVFKYEVSPGVYEYRILKQYQRSRFLVFLDPTHDLSGNGYNLAQAMTAIGSGGLFGKGLLAGTQATYGFLPEAPTDFIFCVLAEELGFVGAMALIGLYVALILVSLSIARRCDDLFGMLVVSSIVGMWLFQILENIGMTCGLMPITGIPLPFVSYGSSFMIVNFIMIGLIGSVSSHQSLLGRK